jgi:FAD-dependent urate hydroxylase
VPDQVSDLPSELFSHTLTQHDLSYLENRRVMVVGGGQSALETAALLHELGADVDVVVRAEVVRWLTESSWKHTTPVVSSLLYSKPDVGPALASHLVAHPRLYTRMGMDRQLRLARRSVRPAGAGWLRPRLRDVPIRLGTGIIGTDEVGDRVKVTLSDGSVDLVDHIVLGTGYRVDLAKYAFLDPELVRGIACTDGYPTLSASCETTVPRLHIVGAPAARRHGPLMRFVAGSDFAARAVTRGLRS